jgi:mono/diheme cytochrome c family protein
VTARSRLPWMLPFLLGGCYPVQLPGCDWERMIVQPRAQPYQPSAYFDDGRAMRPIPPGTVAADEVIDQPALTVGRQGGQPVSQVPLPATLDLLQHGRATFDTVCATCHGVRGDGQSVVAKKMTLRRPPSLIDPPVTKAPPGRVFQVISQGYGLMPGFAAQIPVEARWSVVAYLRALQISQGANLDELPPAWRRRAVQELP